MNEQEKNMTKQEEPMNKQGGGMAMDNKMMMLMMLGCMGMAVLFYAIPSGWFTGGIGIVLLIVLLFACCIPMIKMMMGGKQDGEA